MKLNYRDKVILAIVLAVAIILAGFFALIKPKRQAIKDNQVRLEEVQAQETEIRNKIARIKTLQTKIDETFSKADTLTKIFVPKKKIDQTTLLDQFMQDYAEECKVKIRELRLDDTAAAALTYYYKPYTEVATALRESADINGNLLENVEKESEESTLISGRNVETIMSTRYGLSIRGEYQNVMKYIDMIAKEEDAILITAFGMEIFEEDEDANKNPAPAAGEEGQNNNQSEKEKEKKNLEDNTIVDASVVIQLYSVYNMEKPNTD